jgi:transcriptional regulator with XRE-family HTH domain
MLGEMRRKAGLTQEEVAKKLGLGSPMFISNIERGIARLPVKHYKKVAKLYSVPVGRLIDYRIKQDRARLKALLK